VSDGLTEGNERTEGFAAGSGDPVWDDWDNPPRVPEMPALHLDGFDGPMDLLLDLAERQRIDFGRMSVRDLAEQFVAAMERLASRGFCCKCWSGLCPGSARPRRQAAIWKRLATKTDWARMSRPPT